MNVSQTRKTQMLGNGFLGAVEIPLLEAFEKKLKNYLLQLAVL